MTNCAQKRARKFKYFFHRKSAPANALNLLKKNGHERFHQLISTILLYLQINSMAEPSGSELKTSVESEDVIKSSEFTLPHASKHRYAQIANEDGKFLEEDYIPLATMSTTPGHNGCHEEIDELQPCRATITDSKPCRRRRRRTASETLLLCHAEIKREMTRARRAASDAHNFSTFSLLDSDDDALVKELKVPIYAVKLICPTEQDIIDQGVTCFPGQVTIRPHLEAMEYALDEYKGRRKVPGRMALWVDGSLSTSGTSGTAVVFRENPRVVGSKWTVTAYTVLEFDRLGITHTEALAIMHALRIALVKAVQSDGTDAKASDVVIFSDCVSVLRKIEDFTHTGQCWGRPLLARIVTLASELSILGVKVELHWVPAHRSIPGNHLADALAKRAARKNHRERRFLSTGRV